MKNTMTVNTLKVLCEKAITDGYGDAIVMVQANADHISDIVINGFEGYGREFGSGPKVFSLESNPDEPDSFKDRYEEDVIIKNEKKLYEVTFYYN